MPSTRIVISWSHNISLYYYGWAIHLLKDLTSLYINLHCSFYIHALRKYQWHYCFIGVSTCKQLAVPTTSENSSLIYFHACFKDENHELSKNYMFICSTVELLWTESIVKKVKGESSNDRPESRIGERRINVRRRIPWEGSISPAFGMHGS